MEVDQGKILKSGFSSIGSLAPLTRMHRKLRGRLNRSGRKDINENVLEGTCLWRHMKGIARFSQPRLDQRIGSAARSLRAATSQPQSSGIACKHIQSPSRQPS